MSKDKLFIAENLRLLRKEAKLSQKEVADLLEVDRTTYTYYETGRSNPNYKNLIKLCRIFGVDPYAFFYPMTEKGVLILRDPTKDNDYIYSEFKRKDEQMLLMNYRLLSEENKRRLSEYIKSLGDEENKK